MAEVEIVVQGIIDPEWSGWLEELEIHHLDQSVCKLTGSVEDQSALYGLLAKLRDLGLSLLEVKSSGFEVSWDEAPNTSHNANVQPTCGNASTGQKKQDQRNGYPFRSRVRGGSS